MEARIEKELNLLKKHFKKVQYEENGRWVLIDGYQVPVDSPWNRQLTKVCFKVPEGYPGTPPYGFCVPIGILYEGHIPASYKEPADNKPPYPEAWGFFSWQQENWRPTADLVSGSNLLNFVMSFRDRFKEGR